MPPKKGAPKRPKRMYRTLPLVSIKYILPSTTMNACYLTCQMCGENFLTGFHVEVNTIHTTDEKGIPLPEPREVLESVVMCRACYKKYEKVVEELMNVLLNDVNYEGVL